MAYTATFKTIKNITCTVSIEGAGNGELLLSGDNPVTIQYEQDDFFKPLKMSGCSVKVLTKQPLTNIFSGGNTDIKCTVTYGGATVWFGFLTPNVYSSAYSNVYDELTLEFVDPLSAMANIKFGYLSEENHSFATFNQYITAALNAVCGGLSVSGLPSGNKGCLQRNFIDETDDEDEGAMSWQEVVESIMRYMNKTACFMGKVMYVYDPIDSSDSAGSVTSLGVAKSGGTISMGEVYNKVTVIANNNELGTTIPDVLEETDFVKQETSPQYHKKIYYPDQNTYNERVTPRLESAIEDLYELLNVAYRSTKWDLSETYSLKKYTGYRKDDSTWALPETPSSTTTPSVVPWDDMMEYKTLAQNVSDGMAASGQENNTTDLVASLQTGHITGSFLQRYSHVTKRGTTASVSWNKCLTLAGAGAKATLKDEARPMFVGQGGYFVLSIKYMMSYSAYPQSVIKPFEIDCDKTVDGVYLQMPLKCKLKIGEYSWNGTAWAKGDSTFTVKHKCEDGTYETGTQVSIDNTVDWSLGLNVSDEGALIKLPEDKVLSGKVQFSIECLAENEQHIPESYYHITDMKLQYATATTIKDIFTMEEYDADIKYTGYIADGNAKEADDIEFTTNTYTDRAMSYSYVMEGSGEDFKYVVEDEIPEEKCVRRMVEYYSQPRMIYNNTLGNNGFVIKPWSSITVDDSYQEAKDGTVTHPSLGTFMVGAITYNLAEESADVTLLEKP